jgi:hypothetical protein
MLNRVASPLFIFQAINAATPLRPFHAIIYQQPLTGSASCLPITLTALANNKNNMSKNLGDELTERLRKHAGWKHLEDFGALLNKKPLERDGLLTFLASTACFFREIPGGILALALRVTDDRISQDRFGAVNDGARILLAAVDEYGLADNGDGSTKDHHKLFADLIQTLGVSEEELLDPRYVIPQAHQLAEITRQYYREEPIATSVGFHFASEVTSDREFQLCFTGLDKFSADYFDGPISDSEAKEKLNFYYIHTLVEPMHASSSVDAVKLYTRDPANIEPLLNGVDKFMDAYGQFWQSLNSKISN